MILLSGSDVAPARQLFDAEHVRFVLEAIIAGNTPAQMWVDDDTAPTAALLWDGAHSAYLTGDMGPEPIRWRRLFEDEIVPATHGLLKLYTSDTIAATVLSGRRLQRRDRVLYQLDPSSRPPGPPPMPTGFEIASIDARFAEVSAMDDFSSVIEEIESGWSSVDDFRRNGFGFLAHTATTIVCWCTAEYVSDGFCGTGIETVADYQGRGVATLTASVFVAECARRGLTAHWDAWTQNLPSLAVAEKVGFRRIEEYSIFIDGLA